MAYIGRQPSYGAFEKQSLTADSSTITFSLNYTVGSTSSLMVSVAGVLQEPDTGYSLSGGGTSIVFSAAPTSGDNVFIIYLGLARDVAQFLNTGIVTGHSALTTGIQGADTLLVFDNSAAALKKVTLDNFITGQTAEASVADADEILVFDASANSLRKMTKANFSPTVTLSYLNRTATGDGSTAGFTVTNGAGVADVIVTINGVVQTATSDYSISGTTLTFGTAPEASDAIQIRELPRQG